MLRAAWRNLLGHKLRLALTAVAVLLGVAFLVATFVLTDTIGASLDQVFRRSGSGVDAVVRARAAFGDAAGDGTVRDGVPVDLVAKVRAVPGVADAEGSVQAVVGVVDARGRSIRDPSRGGLVLGANWLQDPELNPFLLVAGRAPRGIDEVVLDRSSARAGRFALGDRVRVQARNGSYDARLVGVVTFAGADDLAGTGVLLMESAGAAERFGTPGQFDDVAVRARTGVAPAQLVRRLRRVLPPGVEAVTGQISIAEQQRLVRRQLDVFNLVLGAFALVALAAGGFLIVNVFGVVVAQRTRDLALLRALGASRRQVLTSVLAEAAVTGVLASVAGVAAGIGLGVALPGLFQAFGVDLPTTRPVVAARTVGLGLGVGTALTLLAALLPAWRAARTPPVAALREVAIERPDRPLARLAVGLPILAGGTALSVLGVHRQERLPVLAGSALVFLAVVALAPTLVAPVLSLVAGPWRRRGRAASRLAVENTRRSPRRTAGTAGALLLAVLLVGVVLVFNSSFRASLHAQVDHNLLGDLQVDLGGGAGALVGVPPTLAVDLAELTAVAAATGVRSGPLEVAGRRTIAYGFDGPAMARLADVGVVDGRLRDLVGPTVAIDADVARRHRWAIGDPVPVRFPDGSTARLRLVATYDDGGIISGGVGGDAFLGTEEFATRMPGALQVDRVVLVALAKGRPAADARRSVERLVRRQLPNARIRDREQVKAAQSELFDRNLGFVLVLLAVSVLIGLLGIVCTLALAVHERTREIGLLRSVGATRHQVRAMVRGEAVLVVALGTVLGLLLGVQVGGSLMLAYRDQLPSATVSIPWLRLGLLAAGLAVCGVLAAIVPARRAARLDVLDAIAVE